MTPNNSNSRAKLVIPEAKTMRTSKMEKYGWQFTSDASVLKKITKNKSIHGALRKSEAHAS